MKKGTTKASSGLLGVVVLAAVTAFGCGNQGGQGGAAMGITPQQMTDALYAVISADRAVYAGQVVDRLGKDEAIKATERFKEEKTLPLPAQMLRMGAEHAQKTNASFSYALLSQWPINKQNAAKTDAEKAGLKFVAENPGKNYYVEEKIADKTYYTAVYPDKAVASACVTCHNNHADSPRKDFKDNEVMGALVIRVPVAK